MTQDDAFLQAILENPADDLSRLVYADWLTDQGNPRGEFIHAQCQLAGMDEHDPQRPHLEIRERELLDRCQGAWLGPLRPLLCRWTFRRGFLDEAAVPAAIYMSRGPMSCPATVRRFEVDLEGFEAPLDAIEFVPESVARENVLLPIGFRGRTLVLAGQASLDADIAAKMRFILNRDIESVAAPTEQVVEAINRHYGQMETESVDCILFDFSASVIDPDADRS